MRLSLLFLHAPCGISVVNSNLPRAFALASTLMLLVGCDGSTPKPQPQSRAIPAQVANPAPAPVPAKPKTDVVAKPKGGNAKSPSPKPLPPGTDPQSVFDVAATKVPNDVFAPTSNPADEFKVEAGTIGIDSTRMTVIAGAATGFKGQQKQGLKLPAGFEALADAGFLEDGMPLRIRCTKTSSVLAYVPAGVVRIGTNSGPSESQPEFSVHVDAYYMEVFEVTAEQFEAYRQDMKEKKKPIPTTLNPTAPQRMPVLGVPWGNAQAYARWAGMDLPSEVELEKAARGPNSLRTPWGDGRAVWPNKRLPDTITFAGSYASDMSPYGIYDLAGNAKEWCNDQYSDQAYREASGTTGEAPHNWNGPRKLLVANQRVVKGGGADWSAWSRQGREIGRGFPDVGFRCVLRIANTEPKASD